MRFTNSTIPYRMLAVFTELHGRNIIVWISYDNPNGNWDHRDTLVTVLPPEQAAQFFAEGLRQARAVLSLEAKAAIKKPQSKRIKKP